MNLIFTQFCYRGVMPIHNARSWDVFKIGSRPRRTLTHVSLFSGCGGMDLGFEYAGFKTIFANDLNPDACQTYRQNIGDIVEQDIRNVTFAPEHKFPDVLTAGFPCQPFSIAGTRKGVADHRGTLYASAVDVVKKLQPKVIVFENVRGLLSSKIGQKLVVHKICEELDGLGYDVSFNLMDASMHHVPQKRLRLFIVGTSKRKCNGDFVFPLASSSPNLSVGSTILDIPKDTSNQKELLRLNPQALKLGLQVPEGGSWKDIPYKNLPERYKKISNNLEKYRYPVYYRRYHRDEIAGTITASFKPENAGVWHPVENRIFSVREIARIQSFPDWFLFKGESVKSKYQQIGNAVPPRLAYELAIQVRKAIQGHSKREWGEVKLFKDFASSKKPLRPNDREVIFSAGG